MDTQFVMSCEEKDAFFGILSYFAHSDDVLKPAETSFIMSAAEKYDFEIDQSYIESTKTYSLDQLKNYFQVIHDASLTDHLKTFMEQVAQSDKKFVDEERKRTLFNYVDAESCELWTKGNSKRGPFFIN